MARPDRAVLADAGLTVVLGVMFVASTAGDSDARALDGLGWALVAANVLPLLVLRRAPLLALACFGVAYPAWASLEYPTHLLQSLPTLAAMFAVGAAPRPLWWRALALLLPAEMLGFAATGIWDVDLLEIGYVAIMFVSGWVLGVVLAARRGYTRALEEQTAALEAARQELARRAVLEERTRIARDLHDILAHAVSVITVQAGVGAHLLERDPEQAKGALRVIEETGRGALGEMRRLLGALRADDLPTEPQPGLASLDRLASQATAAGVPVELQVEGQARPLPAGLEVSAYRIAQEALTNTIKHAPGARARLTVRYRPRTVELEVVDGGGVPAPLPVGDGGHGLRGMRERVALYGGVLEAGPWPGGFRVLAAFPTDQP
ncbi:MAG TPA: sensor histidine kinase [Actinomycetota bacterium]|nr:sensor histidine kinase [Actinomycetota bacterium]